MKILVLCLGLIFASILSCQAQEYPASQTTINTIMALSEEWQVFQNKPDKSLDPTAAMIIRNKSTYMETHVFDLYTMLAMEDEHARNRNLSKYACEALITNITMFKDQMDLEMASFKSFQSHKQQDSDQTLDQFSKLLSKTKDVITQVEKEAKSSYVGLEV